MKKHNKHLKIIAHRGASKIAPENTVASFRRAFKLGADAIELDLHESSDGELVVHHNYLLGHPDNGRGLIKRTNSKKIQKVDAGSWFSKEFVGERIPLLNEVFIEFGADLEYEIELKGTTEQFIANVVQTVHKHSLIDNVEFTSPHLALLCRIKQIEKNIKCGVFFSDYPKWMELELGEEIVVDTMKLVPAEVAHLSQSIITDSLVNSLHKNGFVAHAADCNSKREVENAIKRKCDQLSTNDVSLVLNHSR